MKYLSVSDVAKKWGISERGVRAYCNDGRVNGAFLSGKTWNIPEFEEKPKRKTRSDAKSKTLLEILRNEKEHKIKGGIYHKIQIDLTYNSNHIEGSRLSHDQTRYIYETNTVGVENEVLNIDDIVETVNHFKCIDLIISDANQPMNETLIKKIHSTLKNGTSDSRQDWFAVGNYKKLPNEVGGSATTLPEYVDVEIKAIIKEYNNKKEKTFEDIIDFHYKFEKIHPFQDGNGRTGRLLMFKECLKYNITPFIIDEDLKMYYYRGLKQWSNEKGFLLDTCLSAQDKFKKTLEYFRIM